MNFEQNYLQAKANLNPAQKQAVETIYGPVLAIAGPGTGKTQVLALRIAEILAKTDTAPQNILALTFTEASVIAMRDRLRSLIGPHAHAVRISTFHGFCTEIIARFPEKFLFTKSIETADDLTKIRIIKDQLESGKYSRLAPFASPTFFLHEILGKISLLKREGITPNDFHEIVHKAQGEFAAIPEMEKINAKTGIVKGKYTEELKRIEKWLDLADIYTGYESALRKAGLMDYDDQILFVLRAFKSDEDLLATVRENALFILADEFQDSNGAQMELLELLAGDDPAPNLFAVGDDDQSIYRFQGANLENIMRFLRKYVTAVRIPLTQNYRSTKEILEFAAASIQNGSERLTQHFPDIGKDLLSATGKTGEMPKIFEFASAEAEEFFLLEAVRKLQSEGMPLSEIAILVRTNEEGRQLLHYFEQNDLPAVFPARSNVLHDMRILQFLKLIRLIADPYDNGLFFEVLHFPVWAIASHEIWQEWRKVAAAKAKFFDVYMSADETPEENEIVAPAQKISRFCQNLSEWNTELRSLAFADFFQKVLADSGFLRFLLSEKTRLETLNHFNSLFAEIKSLSRGNPDFSLATFLEILDLRTEFGVAIEDRMLISPEESLRILTTHGAKGLEFEAVFVANVTAGVWGDRKNRDKLSLPEGILSLPYSEEHANEEERRLFFVAATRAKSQLILSFAHTAINGRKQTRSRFLDEIPEEYFDKGEATPYENQVFERFKADFAFHPADTHHAERTYLAELVHPERFSLSPTAFQNYRECPHKFLYENLLRVPHIKERPAILGTALHTALDVYFTEFVRIQAPPPEALALTTFRQALKREILSARDAEEIEREGETLLRQFFVFYRGKFNEPIKTELDFRGHHVFLGDVPITGKIDKIEWVEKAANTVRIIDYKTTTPKSENAIKGVTESQQDNIGAGAMYRQLQFYYLLATRSKEFPYTPTAFRLDFLRPEKNGTFVTREFLIGEADVAELVEEIKQTWQSISSLAFLGFTGECNIASENRGKCEYCELFRQL